MLIPNVNIDLVSNIGQTSEKKSSLLVKSV
jgi:hypothetical protein